MIDRRRRILTIGEITPEDAKVVDIDDEGATLEIDGEREYYTLGSPRVSTVFTEPEVVEEFIYRDNMPGATTAAMNRNEAPRLGID